MRPAVNPAAMCCAIRTGADRSPGNPRRTTERAGGPPVEATRPIAATPAPPARRFPCPPWLRRTTGTSAIKRTASATRRPNRCSSSCAGPGLEITSSAPAAMARKERSSCRSSLTAQTMSTRAGDSAMIAAVAPRPSSRGMFTSMVITSGRSSRAFSTASTPSRASPTMRRSSSCASNAISALRMVSESSATRIRIGWRRVMWPPAGGRSPPGLLRAGAPRRSPSCSGTRRRRRPRRAAGRRRNRAPRRG